MCKKGGERLKKLIGAMLVCLVILAGCSKSPTPDDRFSEYIALWNQQKFDQMYDYLSSNAKQKISKKDFTSRYQKIYKDLQIKNLKVSFNKPKDDKQAKGDSAAYTFSAKMNSIAGNIQFTDKAEWKKEDKNWFLNWNSTFIFPQLKDGDTLGISTTDPVRGEILDHSGAGLAVNGQAYEVGVIPGKMGSQKDQIIQQLSSLLKLSTDQINLALNASWVKPDLFVPLKTVSMQDKGLIAQLIKLEPVQTNRVGVRVYPLGPAAAQLVGYIGQITAEELAKLKNEGYTSTDLIGKRGLEQVYDKELRGTPGVKVLIKKKDGTEETLAEKPVENGKQIHLTIDANLQQKLFNELSGEAGASAAMNPVTGDTLALVSSPSFDPNQATLGFSDEEWKALQNNPQQPLTTRFNQVYAPGSVIKPVTAAIGLESKTLNPGEQVAIKGLKWQKDASWGGYFVTRVHDSSPVNLENAMVNSDNIYFAQAALKMGKDTFTEGLKKFGFDQELTYPFPLETSSIGEMGTDISLADSGYGQGQIQMNIVHLLTAYTPFVNGGNMIKPVLLMEDQKSQVLKPSLVSSENVSLISGILRKVVGDPEGTAHAADIPGYPLSGKTGTAEIKQKQGVTGTENGWFIAYNTNTPNLMIAMMVENVQNRGGSQIPVKKVRDVFSQVK